MQCHRSLLAPYAGLILIVQISNLMNMEKTFAAEVLFLVPCVLRLFRYGVIMKLTRNAIRSSNKGSTPVKPAER